MSVVERLRWRHTFGKVARAQRKLAKTHIDWLVQEGRVLRDGKFVEGRDRWLFLSDDSNDVVAQHMGTRRLSDDDLARWNVLLEQRAERLAARGCQYAMLVAPDTHALYPEKLPAGIRPSRRRPVHQLIDELEREANPVRPIYPIAEMKEEKATRRVGSPIDSHWSDFGAFVAYSALVDQLAGRLPLRRLSHADVIFYDLIGGGDLGGKLAPMRLEVQPVSIVRYPEAELLYDNCVENTGSIAITGCSVAPSTTCLLMADSYSYPMVKYLSETFGRLVVAHSSKLDWRLVEQFEPDLVLNVMAERFLVEVPDDEHVSLAAEEVAKRAARRTRPPLVHWFSSPRWPSPAEAEKLRGHLLASGDVRDATIISVLAYAGLLPQEVTALRWPDVGDGELTIRRHGMKIGEAAPARIVPMIGPLAEDLHEWKARQGAVRPRALVFPGRRDVHWSGGEWSAWREQVFEPAVKACGLDLRTPHDLRHTYCTLTLHSGMAPREVARRVGTETAEIKHVYGALAKILKTWQQPVDAAALVRSARRGSPVTALQGG